MMLLTEWNSIRVATCMTNNDNRWFRLSSKTGLMNLIDLPLYIIDVKH